VPTDVGQACPRPRPQRFTGLPERFAALLRRENPDLLTRFYRPATLAGAEARTGWVAPDLAPFPWTAADPEVW